MTTESILLLKAIIFFRERIYESKQKSYMDMVEAAKKDAASDADISNALENVYIANIELHEAKLRLQNP